MSSTIEIRVNGGPFCIAPGATLRALLEELGRDPRAVAVEYNGEIVRRQRFGDIELAAGDRIEVVHFVQGG